MTRLKLGVAGVGSMGRHHCRNLQMINQVDFLGIYDNNSEHANQVAATYQVTAFSSYTELLMAVDAVILAVPTVFHYAYIEQAILAGKHVFVEKPFVTTREEAKKIEALLAHQPLILQVGHVERFNPAIQKLEHIAHSTNMTCIETRRLGAPQRSLDVDVILDVMIHDIDIVLHLVKSPLQHVMAKGVSRASKQQVDIAMAILYFQNGVIANLVANRISQDKVRTISITELDRFLHTDFLTRELYVYQKTNTGLDPKPYIQEQLIEKVVVPYGEPIYAELLDFCHSILSQQPPKVGLKEAVSALEVAWQIKDQIIG